MLRLRLCAWTSAVEVQAHKQSRNKSVREKAPLRQRDALNNRQLVGLECLACTAPSCQDRVAAGAFCFMAYSRSLSDLNYIRELKFELLPSGLGFVEAKAMANKTATTQEKKARFLPLTAVVQSLAPSPHN